MPSGCRRDNKTSTVALSKRQALAQQKKTEKAQRRFFAQQKSILNSSTDSILDSDRLDFSPITDTVDPTSTITESLARLHEFTASSDSSDYSSLKISLPSPVIGRDMTLGSEHSRYQSRLNRKLLPIFFGFSNISVLNLQTAHDISVRLDFLSRTLLCMER